MHLTTVTDIFYHLPCFLRGFHPPSAFIFLFHFFPDLVEIILVTFGCLIVLFYQHLFFDLSYHRKCFHCFYLAWKTLWTHLPSGVILFLMYAFPFILFILILFFSWFLHVHVYVQVLCRYHFDNYKFWIELFSSFWKRLWGRPQVYELGWSETYSASLLPKTLIKLYLPCSKDTFLLGFCSPMVCEAHKESQLPTEACVVTWPFFCPLCPLPGSVSINDLSPRGWIINNRMTSLQFLVFSLPIACHSLHWHSSCPWWPAGLTHRFRE